MPAAKQPTKNADQKANTKTAKTPMKTSAKELAMEPAKAPAKKNAVKAASAAPDWRAAALERLRALILAAVPGVTEERKWKKPSNPAGVPVWSYHGILCTGETYKSSVKLTFLKGAALPDPAGLFDAGQAGGTRRALDVREGETVDPRAFTALIKAAAALNAGAAAAGNNKGAPRARKS